MELLYIIYILVFLIFGAIAYAVLQLRMAGIKVKDFFSFIDANQKLDKLYLFAKRYEKLSQQQQLIFLMEAEAIFSAFDKVPDVLWEEDYDKYMKVLDTYKSIKVVRWASN